ncbi:MAG: transglutaminase-like domain-containing protein, partial [Desulfobacterales bacterium]
SGNGSICRLVRLPEANDQGSVPPDVETLARYLAPTIAISAQHPQVSSLAQKIVVGADGDLQRIRALLDWIHQHIAKEPVDVFTALDVLKGGRAECQGHALLYAAFARTLGIPTRIVNGIVYAPDFRGFLYHSWNESIVDGRWVAVDPTFGQIPVDATHIKLLEGQNLSDLMPLIDMIGKIKVRILSAE